MKFSGISVLQLQPTLYSFTTGYIQTVICDLLTYISTSMTNLSFRLNFNACNPVN